MKNSVREDTSRPTEAAGHNSDRAERIRVLVLADSPYAGGITSHLISIARAFEPRDDFEVILGTLPGRNRDSALLDRAQASGVTVHEFPMSWRTDVRVLGSLRRFVDEHAIDVVHTHNYRATLVTASARLGVPVVSTCHGMKVQPDLRMRLWQYLELIAMKSHAVTIACSEFVRGWLVRRGLNPERVRTIHNGYAPPGRPDEQHKVPAANRESLGISPDGLVLLYMGRLVPGKGVELLFQALEGIDRATAVIAGEGPLRASLEQRAESLAADVRFIGKAANPEPWYAMADALVLPSEMEALPMALIESCAHGLPAIATRAGGIPEAVSDNATGLLVPPGDVTALRGAIGRIAEPELRARLGRRAREVWRERFTLDIMGEGLARAYSDAAGQR